MPATHTHSASLADVRVSTPHAASLNRRSAGKLLRRFQGSGYGALQTIRIRVKGHLIHLMGDVPTFHMKQIAQEMVRKDLPGHRVINELTVNGCSNHCHGAKDFKVVHQPR